jgi:hypothetical protein
LRVRPSRRGCAARKVDVAGLMVVRSEKSTMRLSMVPVEVGKSCLILEMAAADFSVERPAM